MIPTGTASRYCTESGEWWRHPETNITWANYTGCVNMGEKNVRENLLQIKIRKTLVVPLFQFHEGMAVLSLCGLAVSLCALLLSLFIFFYFKYVFVCTPQTLLHNALYLEITLHF